MADTASEAEVKRNYPVTSGITATAKHEGRPVGLKAQEESLVRDKDKVGIRD